MNGELHKLGETAPKSHIIRREISFNNYEEVKKQDKLEFLYIYIYAKCMYGRCLLQSIAFAHLLPADNHNKALVWPQIDKNTKPCLPPD